ncbi:type I restriction endonuclease [Bradyrhizobium genosp. SA-3]|uniref:type I restriction endonuclease n=1 Tax=Bradyrhizobium genosp. SA-3 TaxID=508868 RepID=UPI001FDF0B07|nr:type I restriction endonuclease [Bradyrhizobium genosp. SA-3]
MFGSIEYGKQPDFKPSPFVQPQKAPAQSESEAAERLKELERRLAEAELARVRATSEAQEHSRARESIEESLRKAQEERALWEALAHEAEQEKLQAKAPREKVSASVELRQDLSYFLGIDRNSLDELQAAAKQAPQADLLDLVTRGEEAAKKIDLDEASTRDLIDQQLRDSGWEADTKSLRHSSGARPAKGRNLAIAEWPTANGPADYALFVGLTLIGVVEAKRKRKNVSAAIDQAERYSVGMKSDGTFSLAEGGPWDTHGVPFVFAANGRSYLKQIETESGIWFRDTRRSANHRRALVG